MSMDPLTHHGCIEGRIDLPEISTESEYAECFLHASVPEKSKPENQRRCPSQDFVILNLNKKYSFFFTFSYLYVSNYRGN